MTTSKPRFRIVPAEDGSSGWIQIYRRGQWVTPYLQAVPNRSLDARVKALRTAGFEVEDQRQGVRA